MAKLIYSTVASLDGYTADAEGNFDWAVPDEEVHAFYAAIWQAVDKVVFSRRSRRSLPPGRDSSATSIRRGSGG